MKRVLYLPSSREDTIIHKWMTSLVNIFSRTLPLSWWSVTVIPLSMSVSSSLPIFWEDPYYQLAPHFFEEGSYLQPVLSFWGESISSTCSSFSKRVHIFIIASCKESLYYHHYSSLWRKSFRTTLILSWKYSKFTWDRGLVNRSETFSLILTYRIFIDPFCTISLT